MLKSVKAWFNAHEGQIDSRSMVTCMFDLSIDAAQETMFRACWTMIQDNARLTAINGSGYTGAASEAINEATETKSVVVASWADRNSHVIAYRQHVGVERRAAHAIACRGRNTVAIRF